MFIQSIKQAFYLLKENRLISIISIVGTALAIAMIMIIVLILRVETANHSPENKRDRSLYVKFMSTYWGEDTEWTANGSLSVKTAKECFKELTIPEAVCIKSRIDKYLAASPDNKLMDIDIMNTDEAFWKIFDFSFIDGKPFDQSDVESGIPKAVITESVSRKLFNTSEAAGRMIRINYSNYTVAGVVKDISKIAPSAYAQVWVPYSTTGMASISSANDVLGMFEVVILARSAKDFDAIQEEAERYRQKYNSQLNNQTVIYRGQPDNQFSHNHRNSASGSVNTVLEVSKYLLIIFILLLVPAINLSGITLSRMKKRFSEIGLRKAFGATQKELIMQVLTESFLFTVIGGVLGLIISWLAAFALKDLLFENSSLSLGMIFDPLLFVGAFFFCLMMNLFSAGIPAWRASRVNIITAINA